MIKKFIDVIKKGSATFLIFLQSTRTIETKSLSPVADSLSYFRVLSLEELRFEQEVVRSKPASKIIEIPRPTDIRTTEKKRRALQSPIIGAKTPPIAYAYSPKILLEEVQSKSDAGIIEILKKTEWTSFNKGVKNKVPDNSKLLIGIYYYPKEKENQSFLSQYYL